MGFAQSGKISLFFRGQPGMETPPKDCIIAGMKWNLSIWGWGVMAVLGLTACSSSKVVKGTARTLETGSNTVKGTNEPIAKAEYIRKLGIDPPPESNQMLLRTIADWMGTPYKYGGSSKNGVDCSGFIQEVYKVVYNQMTPRTTIQLFSASESVSKRQLKEGDLVFFDINSSKVEHAGIYLFEDYFAHASTSRGVMISKLSDIYWSKYFKSGGRLSR